MRRHAGIINNDRRAVGDASGLNVDWRRSDYFAAEYTRAAAAIDAPWSNLWPCSASSCSRAESSRKTLFGSRAVAHQADAPDLAFEVAEPAADLDAEAIEQSAADRGVVDARRECARR